MRDLLSDLKNLFADKEITNRRIHPFAGSFLNKIIETNTTGTYAGKFTALIATYSLAYNPFHAVMLQLPIDITYGMGSVEVRETVVEEFKQFESNYNGIVKDKYFKNKHNIYIQFYPDKLKDINAMTKTNALELINRYATAVHTNVADFTPEFDTKAASFVSRYENATEGQDTTTVSLGEDRSSRDSGRDKLDDALFDAYNFCKYIFKCDYNKMHNLFPLETLSTHPRHEINHYVGIVEALATVNVNQKIYDETLTAMVRNLSDCDMLVGLVATANAAVTAGKGELVKAKRSKSFIVANTGAPGDHFLNVTNLNLTDSGNWEIDIFEQS
ncbi:MAG: hypothetical protein WCL51_02375 [Bacteroidota bacterium]